METNILNIPIVSIRQVRQSKAKYNSRLTRPQDIVDMVFPLYRGIDREMFIVVGMDSNNAPNVINTVSIGTLNSTLVSPREVFKPIILSNCFSFICVHNHPAGSLSPSECDKNITAILRDAGKILDIKLLDHLIISPDKSFYSFYNSGLLTILKKEVTYD